MATRFTIVLVGLVLAVTAGWGLSATIDSVTRPATPPQASLSTSIGLGERTTTELTRLREAVERLASTGEGREAVETRLTL
ncbi:MAG: hypothetical protein GWN07_23335, partial [Actinobacteria bacterium]|nr:hypothetical protein [Actinomycetota bacterium]NIU68357.1 hypothetical protein [Actinomycetota bacterium]NIV88584.1 hypothetical protein [Actinomycetota bacterium]NIW30180.1 hypothetical protein [Actinomycetota bacterium]NIX22595.1 hypothetical protein [Actinomycetota bacterium]